MKTASVAVLNGVVKDSIVRLEAETRWWVRRM